MTENNHEPSFSSSEEENSASASLGKTHEGNEGEEKKEDSLQSDLSPQERIKALEDELAEMQDKWMRSEAENQNIRARNKRELEDTRLYAVQKFARDIVEAAENLRRGVASLPTKQEGENDIITKMREGFETTERSFLSILDRNGIVGTDPTGAMFDANLHQAMAEQPDENHPTGTILQAWTLTWTLHGRLLKPAMVVVAKNEKVPASEN
ncbi:nucleotide exchange factor GrpE [Entomobacter blattae]|uniref:Protein GrpE n=1 Tax=Entomobacter blattae TaxID=2762277 RepID=A0A7H1NPT7_9PROT|nr:nucleotide exchange factor GrpE [Entomobacter blattae]QNT77797.1 Protein GrpE [Entomobacter blattae]